MSQTDAGFEFDPYSLAVQEDPYPFYKAMRDRYPLYWSEPGKCWALSRYEDVVYAAHHPEVFSSAQGNILDDIPARAGATLGTSDPPKHNHLRSLINEVFTRKRVAALEAPVRAYADRYAERFVAEGGGCIQKGVTGKVSTAVICELLGFDEVGRENLKPWVDGLVYRDPETRQMTADGHASVKALGDYVRAQVDSRYAEPTQDLISALIRVTLAGDTLQKDEIVWLVFTLIGAGIESSSSLIGNALVALADHPGQRELLVADPGLLPGAIEEFLRYDTPTQRFRRTAVKDIEMHGQTIKVGDAVLLMYGSANRDERVFERADELDVTRKPTRHLGFGHGIHICLGAALARLSVKIVLETVLGRTPNYVVDRAAARRMHSPTFRGFTYLPVDPNIGAPSRGARGGDISSEIRLRSVAQ